ncbi:MAG: hypothetical protein COA69_03935 [Robiginitomaculum sp.]|nr:MAG: hypothetical protein COA69_03935 [Robiginitomaculum sp.]
MKHAQSKDQGKDHSEDQGWDIKIDTPEDAQRMARVGAYAGYSYTLITTLLAGMGMMAGLSQMGKMPEIDPEMVTQQGGAILGLLVRFVLYWALSWRTYSGKGIIAAPLLLVLIVAEILFAVFALVSNGVVPGLLLIIIAAVVGFVLVAGVKGNWANRAFRKGVKI